MTTSPIARAAELPPGRREAFVWAHAWRRGFSLVADLSGWPDQCAGILAAHRGSPITVLGAAQDGDGVWHLVGSTRCCATTTTSPVHGRHVVSVSDDPAQIPAGQRCTESRAVWPGATGPGTKHLVYRLGVIVALGDQCTICRSRPGQMIDHDHLTGATRGYLDRECNMVVDRCRHLDGCSFADYLNATTPAIGAYPDQAKVMRQQKYQSRRHAFDAVMAGGVSPGVGHLATDDSAWRLEVPGGLPEPLPHSATYTS